MDIDFKALLADAKSASALIPDGDHQFECVAAEARLSSTGSPQIQADFLCQTERYSKRTVRNWFTLTMDNPVALAMFFRHMKALGMDEAFFLKSGDRIAAAAVQMIGTRVTCTIKTEAWNGEDRNKIAGFKGVNGAARKASGGGPAAPGRPAPAPAPRAAAPAPAPARAAAPAPVQDAADDAGDNGYDEEPPF